MSTQSQGTLIIIGGHEDKQGDCTILRAVAEQAGSSGKLVIVTAATQLPQEVADEYRAVWARLGVARVEVVDVRTREDAFDRARVAVLADADVVFFTGGNQLRITSQLGGSPLYDCLLNIYRRGGTIAGTSAGAAAMPATMLTSGPSDASVEADELGMAPGLGLLPDVVIDSHFAERGRIGRLLGAVVQNPRNLGLGIDEDTAIVVRDGAFTVLGSGGVYVVDGGRISYSSLAHGSEGVVSIADITLHLLKQGDGYDVTARQATFPPSERAVGA